MNGDDEKQMILGTVEDLVLNFLYYDRREDEDLPRGAIEEALANQYLTVDEIVEQFRKMVPRYMDRHHEKAGMTGWAQVNGLRGDTSIYERTKYDLWYIENWSIWLDIKILLRTFFRPGRNAY